MSGADLIVQQPWVIRAGWTLLHFLWQGSATAILLDGPRRLRTVATCIPTGAVRLRCMPTARRRVV